MKKFALLLNRRTSKNMDKIDKLVTYLKDACHLKWQSSSTYPKYGFYYIGTKDQYKAVKDLIKGLYNKKEIKICVQ